LHFSTFNSLLFLSTGYAEDVKLAGDIQSEDTGDGRIVGTTNYSAMAEYHTSSQFKMLS
jgi:hypothetical protein